jgi:glycopeptide antibiotics resistance protein
MKKEKQNTLTIILFGIYLLLLVGIILFKLPFQMGKLGGMRVVNLIPFHGSFDDNGVFLLSEVINNILLFIPLGFYIGIIKNELPFEKKFIPVIGLTLVFEIIQFIFGIGITDITDIIDNTIGGIAGIGMGVLLFKIFKNRTVQIVNILALIITVCVVIRFAHLFYLSHFVMRRLPDIRVPRNIP